MRVGGENKRCVTSILSGSRTDKDSENPKTAILASIIDGFIDADKLDYHIRGSHSSYLKYGNAIDKEGLITNLTIDIYFTDRTFPELILPNRSLIVNGFHVYWKLLHGF